MNFNLDDGDDTPLQCICRFRGLLREMMGVLLKDILNPLHSHPNDTVDWGLRTWNNCDFLSLAAFEGVPSDLYPLVKNKLYYVNAAKSIVLRCVTLMPRDMEGRERDWARLLTEDRSHSHGNSRWNECEGGCRTPSLRVIRGACRRHYVS